MIIQQKLTVGNKFKIDLELKSAADVQTLSFWSSHVMRSIQLKQK